MNRLLMVLGVLALAVPALAAEPPPIEVMVLGTYHFNNPGRDVHNMQADDVLTPERQRDLEALYPSGGRRAGPLEDGRGLCSAMVASSDVSKMMAGS